MNPYQLFNYAAPAAAPAASPAAASAPAPAATPTSYDPGTLVAAILLAKEARVGIAATRPLVGIASGFLAINKQKLPLVLHIRANITIGLGNGEQHWLLLGTSPGQVLTLDSAHYVMAPGDQGIFTLLPEQSLYGQVLGPLPASSDISPISVVEADVGQIYNNLVQMAGAFR